MYKSLEQSCKSYHLHIFAFDDVCYDVLKKLELKNATVISLREFEDRDLLTVKPSRSPGEYCWTCTPSTILYCLEKYRLPHCTYIDADLWFYSDPSVLLDELGANKSILITEHRYTPEYDRTATSGRYCVQFVTFKNDENGLRALEWWKNACLEWCYNRFEDNKFGDQMYLDDWTERFEGVHVLQHQGGGVAPWNVQQYKFNSIEGTATIKGVSIEARKVFDLVFYHFHDLKYCIHDMYCLCISYRINKNVLKTLYRPYVMELNKAKEQIRRVNQEVAVHEIADIPWWGKKLTRHLRIQLFNRYRNYYKKSYILNGLSD